MGFDKPDLAFVILPDAKLGRGGLQTKGVGRAGRALDAACGVLLSGTEETHITNCS